MIKHIIVIDDSDYKRERIIEYLNAIFPDAEVFGFEGIQPALKFMMVDRHDEIKNDPNRWLIATDMCMPWFVGGEIERDAGTHILMEMERRKFESPAIIVSSEEVDIDAISEEYGGYMYQNLLGAVKDDSSVFDLPKYERLLKNYIV